MPNLVSLLVWIQFAMRAQASRCPSFHNPGHAGVMRPSGLTQVISAITSEAPPSARAPRCTRWKSPGTPSTAEYCAIGDTTTRFFSVTLRTVYGVNIGGGTGASGAIVIPARSANQRSKPSSQLLSRRRRFS